MEAATAITNRFGAGIDGVLQAPPMSATIPQQSAAQGSSVAGGTAPRDAEGGRGLRDLAGACDDDDEDDSSISSSESSEEDSDSDGCGTGFCLVLLW